MTFRESIALQRISSRKKIQEPAFMTGPRSYRNCVIVVERDMCNELLPCYEEKPSKPNEIQKTLKNFSANIWILRHTRNDSLQQNRFWKLPASIGRTGATTVLNLYKKIVIKVLKIQMHMSASAAHLQMRANRKERFKHPIKTAHCLRLESKTRRKMLRNGPKQVFWNDDSTTIQMSLTGFLQISSDKLPCPWKV